MSAPPGNHKPNRENDDDHCPNNREPRHTVRTLELGPCVCGSDSTQPHLNHRTDGKSNQPQEDHNLLMAVFLTHRGRGLT